MKHLLIVKNLANQEDVERISEALSEASIEFEINLNQKTVNVLHRGDAVVTAKRIMNDLGYQIA